MDVLGERIIRDEAAIRDKMRDADMMEKRAAELRQEAREIRRLLDLARFAQRA